MEKKSSSKLLAPFIIAGMTVGFLVSAYKFVFSKSKEEQQLELSQSNEDEQE